MAIEFFNKKTGELEHIEVKPSTEGDPRKKDRITFILGDRAKDIHVVETSLDSFKEMISDFYNQYRQIAREQDIEDFVTSAYEEGYEIGEEAGYEAGKDVGYEEGREEGYDVGYQEGYDAGIVDGGEER